jgi:hypothetical protein
MNKNGPFIYAVAADRKKLMAKFGCNASSISESLRFQGGTRRPREIRSYAVNFLGCIPMNV